MTNAAANPTLANPNAATLTGRTEDAFVLDNVADWQTLAAGQRPIQGDGEIDAAQENRVELTTQAETLGTKQLPKLTPMRMA